MPEERPKMGRPPSPFKKESLIVRALTDDLVLLRVAKIKPQDIASVAIHGAAEKIRQEHTRGKA